jgi:hypothetical protein
MYAEIVIRIFIQLAMVDAASAGAPQWDAASKTENPNEKAPLSRGS